MRRCLTEEDQGYDECSRREGIKDIRDYFVTGGLVPWHKMSGYECQISFAKIGHGYLILSVLFGVAWLRLDVSFG